LRKTPDIKVNVYSPSYSAEEGEGEAAPCVRVPDPPARKMAWLEQMLTRMTVTRVAPDIASN